MFKRKNTPSRRMATENWETYDGTSWCNNESRWLASHRARGKTDVSDVRTERQLVNITQPTVAAPEEIQLAASDAGQIKRKAILLHKHLP